ncbi:MAG: sarcosine oxidase [Rhodospirillaceae bacterium]|nr:MAG: sarcosine oxidase [Rhodospirillaceae bacterium]
MNALPKTVPNGLQRRSFLYRQLQQAGAEFAEVNGGAVAIRYGNNEAVELDRAKAMGIADLSVLPRTGFKGTGTVEWLQTQGLTIGQESNVAYRQSGGEWAARLAPTEIFLVDSLAGSGQLIDRLNQSWAWGSEKPRKAIGYPTPRQDSHAWFMVTGQHAPDMFAKICGIDFRLHKFAVGQIAQTSIAKMSGIIIRTDLGTTPAYHLLADIASADYLWPAVQDAMKEFNGGPVGLNALRRLEG